MALVRIRHTDWLPPALRRGCAVMAVGLGVFVVALAAGLAAWGVVSVLRRRGGPPPEADAAPDAGSFARPSPRQRRNLRRVASATAAMAVLLYLSLALVVQRAEADTAARNDSTWGAYLNLAVLYLIGAALLAIVDLRPLWLVGAALQGLVLALFAVFGLGLGAAGPADEGGALSAPAMEGVPAPWWAVTITALQVVLLGLLAYLATTPTGRQPAQGGSPSQPVPQPQTGGRP